nr:hypothetical protein [Pseudomonas sp.]
MAPSSMLVAPHRNHHVLLVAVTMLGPARHMPRLIPMIPRRCRTVVVMHDLMALPVIRGIRQHCNQHCTDCRPGQHRHHDIAITGRSVTGNNQAGGQQADLEYATGRGVLLSKGTFPASMERQPCVSCGQPDVNPE